MEKLAKLLIGLCLAGTVQAASQYEIDQRTKPVGQVTVGKPAAVVAAPAPAAATTSSSALTPPTTVTSVPAAATVTPAPTPSAAPSAAATTTATVTAERVQAIYQSKCSLCHAAGVANAPKFGNKEDWDKHLQGTAEPDKSKQIAKLLESAKKGKGAMPPSGTCTDCSDAELTAAIHYMISGGKELPGGAAAPAQAQSATEKQPAVAVPQPASEKK